MRTSLTKPVAPDPTQEELLDELTHPRRRMGMSTEDIAILYGTTRQNIEDILGRALQKMRKSIFLMGLEKEDLL
jgi:transcriptional regulator